MPARQTAAMLLDIVQVGDPVLRRPARSLEREEIATPFIQELIVSMQETMYEAPGVGLAAPQVGESLQLAVVEDDGSWLETMSPARRAELERSALPFTVLINPTLEPMGDETVEFFEGCLSIAGFSGLVRRHRAMRVWALDQKGDLLELELEGWPARILQHELDHLAGRLYIDRMDPRTFTTNENLVRFFKSRPSQAVREQMGAPLRE
jgi:peptide deformylase